MRLAERTWEPNVRLSEVTEGGIADYYGEPEGSNGSVRWSENRLLGLHQYEIIFDRDTSEITVEIWGQDTLYLFLIGLPLVLATVLFSGFSADEAVYLILLSLGYISICHLLFAPGMLRDLNEIGEIVDQKTKPFTFVSIGVGVLLFWYRFQIIFPTGIVNRYMTLVSIVFLGYAVSYDLVPGVSMDPGTRVLAIPVTALSWLLIPPILFAIFAFQPGWMYLRTQLYQRNLEQLSPSNANLSVMSDIAEGYTIDSLDVLAAQFALDVVQVANYIIILLLLGMLYHGRKQITNIKSFRISPLRSTIARFVLLAVFILSNIGLLLIIIPAFAVLLHGISGSTWFLGSDLVYAQPFTSQSLEFEASASNLIGMSGYGEMHLQGQEKIQATELVTASFNVLDLGFSNTPLLPPRVLSLAFFAILFLPQFLLTGFWLSNFITGIRSKFTLLRQGESIQRDVEVVPESISVLVVDDGDQQSAIAHPISVLFGWKNYIVVSESVRDRLSQKELDAVLAHEVYHIQNSDLKMNAVASIVSLGFGGRNALLAFYDYPKIEQDADLYAKDQVGLHETVVAIDKMDVLAKRSSGWKIPGDNPGFVDGEELMESAEGLLEHIGRTIDYYAEAPGDLLFGGILLEEAHADAESRIQRLRDDGYLDGS